MKQRLFDPKRLCRWTDGAMELLIGFFLSAFLLIIPLPGASEKAGYGRISELKTECLYALVGLILLLALLCFVRECVDARKTGKRLRPLTGTQLAALGFLLCTLASAALSPYGEKAWVDSVAHETALTVVLYVLFFLAVSRWGRATRRLRTVLFWTMAAFCLLCLLQMLGKNPFGLYPRNMSFYDGYDVQYRGAYLGTVGNVDLASAFLALVIPILAVSSLKRPLRTVWQFWLLAAFCTGILIWLRVLCGLVGLLFGAAVSLVVLCPALCRKRVLLVLSVSTVVGIVLLWSFDPTVQFLHELHELLHGRAEDSFGTGRFFIWRQMLERVPERLWFGIGPDAVREAGLLPFVRYDASGSIAATAAITDAHCYPLQILFCQGLLALLCWLTTVGLVLRRWVAARANRAAAALGSGLVCFLGAMCFCFSSVIIMPFFWLTLGLLEAETTDTVRLLKSKHPMNSLQSSEKMIH